MQLYLLTFLGLLLCLKLSRYAVCSVQSLRLVRQGTACLLTCSTAISCTSSVPPFFPPLLCYRSRVGRSKEYMTETLFTRRDCLLVLDLVSAYA